jgi:parvulin-like peptidyl-prolyl isomerase
MRPTHLVLVLALGGCGLCRDLGFAREEPDPSVLAKGRAPDEPERIAVRHVLVSFEGVGSTSVTRTREDAKRLADRVLADARAGRDFGELIRLYTDDRGASTLAIANWGVLPEIDEVERRKLASGFADVAFRLAPGEIGLVEYDSTTAPYGWHVVQRVK